LSNKKTKEVKTNQVDFDPNNKQHNKLLVVYPFKVAEKELQNISSRFKELGGDHLGVIEGKQIDSAEGDHAEEQVESVGESYITIRVWEMICLRPGEWVNDSIINIFL
jgi:Ulp1 family protease